MKSICERVQERLGAEGLEALRGDPTALRHLGECTACSTVLAALGALDQALGALPAHDAPDDAVERVLEKVEKEARTPDGRERLGAHAGMAARRWRARPAFLVAAGTAAAVAFVAWVVPPLYQAHPAYMAAPPVPESGSGDEHSLYARAPRRAEEAGEAGRRKDAGEQVALLDQLTEDAGAASQFGPAEELGGIPGGVPGGVVGGVAGGVVGALPGEIERPEGSGAGVRAPGKSDEVGSSDRDVPQTTQEHEVPQPEMWAASPLIDLSSATADSAEGAPKRAVTQAGTPPTKTFNVDPEYPQEAIEAGVEGTVILQITIAPDGTVSSATVLKSIPMLDAAAVAAVRKWRYVPPVVDGRRASRRLTVTVEFRLGEEERPAQEHDPGGPGAFNLLERARRFLARRSSTEGLVFREARGYWANTYVPGDPSLRLVQARLAAWDRSPLEAAAGVPLRLHDRSSRTAQPFDAPGRGALSLFVHADRRGIEGASRMLVQVGLQGSQRPASRRPAMNLALVLDLRGDLPVDTAAGLRALVFAFAQARQVGDRFRLVVAGRPGGIAVEPSHFRHGPLTVALARWLEGGEPEDGESLDLVQAVATAIEAVGQDDDPETPLGSSGVVLLTGQPIGAATPVLARLAHQGAVAGIPLSVVAVGPAVPLGDVDRLALAGQGSRRHLASRSEALALVEQELTSAARVVARAVRLRIRLAPGVRLVEVVGSRPLGEPQARRVREAERSIDLRLARNLGLEADRGEDEDGIQIVIPSFRAGDAHAILLDVVAPGPGPIAEVTARYKDIVELRNGVARASLHVGAGSPAEGPLERNVLKNLLAVQLSETLIEAGELLAAGQAGSAAELLEGARRLRTGLCALRPAFAGDPELGEDLAMLAEYARLLRGNVANRRDDRARLADSLRYAGSLKILPRPAAVGGRGA